MAQFQATTTAGDAPNIEPGMYDGLLARVEGKRVTGGLYTKDTVNGDPKLEWTFNLLDDDGDVMFEEGDAIEVSKLTGVGFNIASKTVPQEVKVLKALLTAAEFAAFEAGEGTPDSDAQTEDGGLLGRKVQVEVFIKENGWPGIGNVIPARVARKSAAKAAK